MKKFILSLLITIITMGIMPCFADDIEEDYLDIAAKYCVIGDYNAAMLYLDKILERNPNNKQVSDLKRGLTHVIAQDKKSFIASANPYIKEAMEAKRIGNEKLEYENLIKATKNENAYLGYFYLGNYFRDKNDYMKALDEYNRGVS